MLNAMIHLLTFVAFSAHGVLGWCDLHHHHEHRTHVHDELCHSKESEFGSLTKVESLCGHSPFCNETACAFKLAKFIASPDFTEITSSGFASDRLEFAVESNASRYWVSNGIDRYTTAKSRCALLQSWQL